MEKNEENTEFWRNSRVHLSRQSSSLITYVGHPSASTYNEAKICTYIFCEDLCHKDNEDWAGNLKKVAFKGLFAQTVIFV
jgi:hypothetical protein